MKPFILDKNKDITIMKCIRMPEELVKKIEKVIKNKDISFTNFVIQACTYALENLENSDK